MMRTILALILGLYLAIVALVTFVGLDSIRHSHESTRNTIALCALRDNYDVGIAVRRSEIKRSQDYLRDHPHGAPGIPTAIVEQGIRTNQLALSVQLKNRKALDVINCNP